jgi:perosamine synthetase
MEHKALDVFKKSVTNNFGFLKSSQNIRDAFINSIPIEDIGFLVPLSNAHKNDISLMQKLTLWRNVNVQCYPTQFEATLDSTSSWFNDRILNVKDRILFLVVDNKGTISGHMGFNGCHNNHFEFEIDNVIKSNSELPKGFFSKALFSLIEWARKIINVETFFLRVMEENDHAINFYEKNNFVKFERIPLVKENKKDLTTYRQASNSEKPDKFFLKMIWRPSLENIGKNMILTAGPSISAKEAAYSYDAASKGWNGEWSKYLTRFEKAFAEYVGVDFAMATSSCTGALQIALMALDIGPGDEVIVPDQTWVATANAVRYVGATPIFADVEIDTWNIDSNSVESLITHKTKAIMPVHMYGHPSRMTNLISLANKFNLKIVEDAAPAIGAEWQGKKCGTFGSFAGFSFQGAKLMVTGEGGMLVTNDKDLYQKAFKIWDQGRNPTRTFWIDEDGVKFKMSNIQAALGLAQLERVDELIEMKRRIFSWYEEGLEGLPHIVLNKEVEGAKSIYWMTSILLDLTCPISRDDLIKKLKLRNVDTRPVFPAISQYPIWPVKQDPKPIAFLIGNQAINLPSGVCLTKDQIMYVTKQIKETLNYL